MEVQMQFSNILLLMQCKLHIYMQLALHFNKEYKELTK